jgi:hypothetical protein
MNRVIFDANFMGPQSVGATAATFVLPDIAAAGPPINGLVVQIPPPHDFKHG